MNKKVLISYHYFAHYRLPVIKELSLDDEIDYTFISGRTTNRSIKVISDSDFKANGINWKNVNNIWIFNKKLLWQTGLLWECVIGKYDSVILLGNPYAISTWAASLVLKFCKVPTYFWAHATIRNKIRDKLKIVFLNLPDGILLYGNWARNRLIDLGFNQEKLHVIYNSLDHKKQIDIREKLSKNLLISVKKKLFKYYDLPVLLFIGRITISKSLNLLIETCEILHTKGIPINLLIIGDGEEKNGLKQLTEKKCLEDYTYFYGETYDEEEIAPLVALSSICVSPGDVGLTAIHALTYGTPVITHNNPFKQGPEFEAIIPGETGMFFEQGSADSLSEIIQEWLEKNRNDRELVRLHCYEIVDKYYNPAYQAKKINSVIMGRMD